MSQAKEVKEEAAAERAYRREVAGQRPVELDRKELLRQSLVDLEQIVVDLQLGPNARSLHEAIEKLRSLV